MDVLPVRCKTRIRRAREVESSFALSTREADNGCSTSIGIVDSACQSGGPYRMSTIGHETEDLRQRRAACEIYQGHGEVLPQDPGEAGQVAQGLLEEIGLVARGEVVFPNCVLSPSIHALEIPMGPSCLYE